jgi:periplasmic protein CpxP/Spy
MSSLFNNKFINLLLIILLVGNMVTMVLFWWRQSAKSNDQPQQRREVLEFLVKELKMSPKQEQQLMRLREEHRRQVPELRKEIDIQKEKFFGYLKDTSFSALALDSLFQPVGNAERAFEKSIWLHFRDIRAVCTPTQKEEFDSIVFEALKIMRPNGGPRRGPDGHGPPL